ncbi:Txe/YoeB family addiction module toxin [Aquimarina agarilytica]|uniref:Txe/YoeB family addiction module toxin n=1 Tax=Aquimarina agarilytica TaxID=1087449 RepID=UPI00028A417B|nr:Txe/YoeB family addiction module toxin [Aquimarina agarilytica]
MYTLDITVQAKKDIAFLKKTGGKTSINKIEQLLLELMQHPREGTGRVEQLKGDRHGQWSRRIDRKHRLIYTIDDDIVTVTIIAARGHYDDK